VPMRKPSSFALAVPSLTMRMAITYALVRILNSVIGRKDVIASAAVDKPAATKDSLKRVFCF
jgi:hypothetical protein